MSAVTASIVVGTRHRSDPGIQPRWVVLLHEGTNHAWHLVRLQLTSADLGAGHDAPPGVLWRSSSRDDLVDQLALLLHLYAARTPEVTEIVKRSPALSQHRLDLDALDGPELGDYGAALRIAGERGRELLLAATIHRGSRLTEEALLSMPDWELDVAHTAVTRHWNSVEGFVTTDYRELDARAGHVSDEDFESWIEAGDAADEVGDAHEADAPHSGGGVAPGAWRTRTSDREPAEAWEHEPEGDDPASEVEAQAQAAARVGRRRWGLLGHGSTASPAPGRAQVDAPPPTPRTHRDNVRIGDLFGRD